MASFPGSRPTGSNADSRAWSFSGAGIRSWRPSSCCWRSSSPAHLSEPGAGIRAGPNRTWSTAQVAPIPVTPLEKELKFPPLTIEFSESAARLEDLKNPTLQHVRLDPPTAGAWKWINDRKLSFAPAQDWPAEKKFRIIFDKEFFPAHVRMEKLEHDVSTPPFKAEMKNVTLSEDAKEPGVQRVLATIELTHAVEPGQLEKFLDAQHGGRLECFPAERSGAAFLGHLRLAQPAGLRAQLAGRSSDR